MNPSISIIVSTRNRPDDVAECVRLILADRRPDLEVVVVDQSQPEVSRRAREALGADTRLHYIQSATRGLSISRNIAIKATCAPVLAFTDDDCRIGEGWAQGILAEFARDKSLGLVFGAVMLRQEDRARGYAAEFEPELKTEYMHRFPDIRTQWGVGANMAVRRDLFERLGPFDPLLGAGAPLMAAEETDLIIRAIDAGYKVAFTPEVSVVHLGIREGPEASKLLRGYGLGLGAMLAKHVRLRTPGAAQLFAQWVDFNGRRSIKSALDGSRHPGFGLLAGFLWGALRSAAYGVDRDTQLYTGRWLVG
jgi:GT2 family glycosyltransferase